MQQILQSMERGVRAPIVTPVCGKIEAPSRSTLSGSRRRRFPAAAMHAAPNTDQSPASGYGSGSSPGARRNRRNGGDRSPFNPVIVLRGSTNGGGTEEVGGRRRRWRGV
ncbi:hypothetical protein HAX54_039232 [Datura stramonium]|uniref:Uncharacterized protein n=1 Tax=Datura stramonium TaxID=4076 RepID=A0ABS8VP04_DATST|nr:hypothetical protein [Datura stramonium]